MEPKLITRAKEIFAKQKSHYDKCRYWIMWMENLCDSIQNSGVADWDVWKSVTELFDADPFWETGIKVDNKIINFCKDAEIEYVNLLIAKSKEQPFDNDGAAEYSFKELGGSYNGEPKEPDSLESSIIRIRILEAFAIYHSNRTCFLDKDSKEFKEEFAKYREYCILAEAEDEIK